MGVVVEPEESNQQQPLIFAYYVTGHGFGHATRVVEVHLIFLSSFVLEFFSFLLQFMLFFLY